MITGCQSELRRAQHGQNEIGTARPRGPPAGASLTSSLIASRITRSVNSCRLCVELRGQREGTLAKACALETSSAPSPALCCSVARALDTAGVRSAGTVPRTTSDSTDRLTTQPRSASPARPSKPSRAARRPASRPRAERRAKSFCCAVLLRAQQTDLQPNRWCQQDSAGHQRTLENMRTFEGSLSVSRMSIRGVALSDGRQGLQNRWGFGECLVPGSSILLRFR